MNVSPSRTGLQRALIAISPLLIIACIGVWFWPGLSADWGRDDFMQLAMARLVDSPIAFFFSDHFVLPNGAFRPMGYASYWLGQALYDTSFYHHALMSWMFLLVLALGFWTLLRRFEIAPMPALLATLIFSAHPVAIGTTLWWSARFDILAVLFVLFALDQAQQARLQNSLWFAISCCLSLLSAMLSKEIGLIGVVGTLIIWQHWAWTERQHFRLAQVASVLAVLTALLFLLWRRWILGTAGSEIAGDIGLLSVFSEGIWRWMVLAPDYLRFAGQLQAQWLLLVAAVALLIMLLLPRGQKLQSDSAAQWPLLGCGLALLLLPALLQAPVVRLNALPVSDSISSVEAAMQSRLFFMSLAGFSLLVGFLLNRRIPSWRSARGAGAFLACALLIGTLGLGAREHSARFAEMSSDNALLAHAALASVEGIDWPEPPCHLVFEGIQPPPEWDIFVSMDSVIKALSPNLDELDHCFIHANYPTFYHFIASEHADAASAPLRERLHEGQPLARRPIGGLTIVHLDDLKSLTAEEKAQLPRWQINEARSP
ncbi:MAG: hypothetical protein AAGJ52_09080 [Pseudomonadota bacterium]